MSRGIRIAIVIKSREFPRPEVSLKNGDRFLPKLSFSQCRLETYGRLETEEWEWARDKSWRFAASLPLFLEKGQ